MDSELQKIIEERTRALPQNVKEALGRVDVEAKLVTIFRDNDLRVDQSGALETEVLLTILGIQPTGAFVGNLIKHVHVSGEIAEKIATQVNENIFKEIRLDMSSSSIQAPSYIPPTPDITPSAVATGATPPPANLPVDKTPDSIQTKLEQPFRLAPDSVVVKRTTDQQPTTKPPLGSIEKGTYPKGSDPYREPIN